MPLGDSITEGDSNAGASYRYWLWESLPDADARFDFVGSRSRREGGLPYPVCCADFDTDHEAISGRSARYFVPRIEELVRTERPDVLLVHLGTNDLRSGGEPAEVVRDHLRAIVVNARRANPDVDVLLAQIIPFVYSDKARQAEVPPLNALLPALAAELDTPRSRVLVVDQYTGFDARRGYDTVDNLHPSVSREQKMAARWLPPLLQLEAAHQR